MMFQRSWFWDRLAKRYARMPVADQAAYETKLEKTRAFLRPDSRVLEFGCGTGSTAILHAPPCGAYPCHRLLSPDARHRPREG